MNASSASMSSIDEALSLLRDGRVVDAEQLMKRAVQEAADEHGPGSARWADAQSDMGNVLLRAQQPAWAAECFRSAVTVRGDRPKWLGYQLNLGIALSLSGRLEEGAEALRKSVSGRREVYGRRHLAYASGLEPLADVLLRLGDFPGALKAIDEALPIFLAKQHERVASSVALRAVIMLADGQSGPFFPGLEELPDHIVELIAAIATSRVQKDVEPDAAYLFVAHLANALRERLGPDHAATVRAFGSLATRAGERGDHVGRTAALRRVLASYDRQGRAEDGLSAATSVAEALNDAGETENSLLTYEDAAARAKSIGRPELISQTLFDWGVALQEAGQPETAVRRLSEALTAARGTDDKELLGHAAAAYGICLQHLGRIEEAREALTEGLDVMDPRGDAALAARGHLTAILDGQDCGCAGLRSAVEEAYTQFVVDRAPEGLLQRFAVRIVGNSFMVDVEFQRPPTEDEVQHLNEIVRAGHAEFSR